MIQVILNVNKLVLKKLIPGMVKIAMIKQIDIIIRVIPKKAFILLYLLKNGIES